MSYRIVLLLLLLVLSVASLFGAPAPPVDLTLHHLPTIVFLAWLVLEDRRRPFSNLSHTLFFLFLLTHIIGARYLYSNVPFDSWCESLFGVHLSEAIGATRNHWDRFVHFVFGLLMIHPAREIFEKRVQTSRGMVLALAVGLIVVCGTTYELLEWLISVTMAAETADNYNGQQGDMWDAQKDMALALVGALIAVAAEATMLWPRRTEKERDRAQEFGEGPPR